MSFEILLKSYRLQAHFLNESPTFLTLGFFFSLYILDIDPLLDVELATILSYFVGFLFTQLITSLAVKKFF